MVSFFKMCGMSKSEPSAVAPRASYNAATPITPLSETAAKPQRQSVAHGDRSVSVPVKTVPTVVGMTDSIDGTVTTQKSDSLLPRLSDASSPGMTPMAATPQSASKTPQPSVVATSRAPAERATSSNAFELRDSDCAFGRANTTSFSTVSPSVPSSTVRPATLSSVAPARTGSSSSVTHTLNQTPMALPPHNNTVRNITGLSPSMTMPASGVGSDNRSNHVTAPASHAPVTPVPPSSSARSTAMMRSATATTASPSASSVPATVMHQLNPADAHTTSTVKSQTPTTAAVPASHTTASSAAPSTSAKRGGQTFKPLQPAPTTVATVTPRVPHAPGNTQIAASAPAPRRNTAQTGTVTCQYSTTKPVANAIYPMNSRGRRQTQEEAFAPLEHIAPDLQAARPTPLLQTHYGSNLSDVNNSRPGTSTSSSGMYGGAPQLSQVHATSAVSAVAPPTCTTRAASVPVAATSQGLTHRSEQSSAVPETARAASHPSSAMTSHATRVDAQRTCQPDLKEVENTPIVMSDRRGRRSSVVEASETQKADEPVVARRLSLTGNSALPAGHSTVVPGSPRPPSYSASSRQSAQPQPPHQQQRQTAAIDVSRVASHVVQQGGPAQMDPVSAFLMENSRSFSQNPSTASQVSQDIWIDAYSTPQTTEMRSGRDSYAGLAQPQPQSQSQPPLQQTPVTPPPQNSRPSTAPFVDGAAGIRTPASRRLTQPAAHRTPLYAAPRGSGHGMPPLAPLPPASIAAGHDGHSGGPMELSGFSPSATDGEDLLSLTSPPHGSLKTATPSEDGSSPPAFRVTPPRFYTYGNTGA